MIGSFWQTTFSHGPLRLHLDARDFYCTACPCLAHEAVRVRLRQILADCSGGGDDWTGHSSPLCESSQQI
jgi:hypothetical protein